MCLMCAYLFICVLTSIGQPEKKIKQVISKPLPLPEQAGQHALRLFKTPDGVLVVTEKGLLQWNGKTWSPLLMPGQWTNAAIDVQFQVWLISTSAIKNAVSGDSILLPPIHATDRILCAHWQDAETLWVGTTKGLWRWRGKWQLIPALNSLQVRDINSDKNDRLWVATNGGLWRYNPGSDWLNMDEVLMARGNLRNYFALATSEKEGDILYSTPYSVGTIAANGEHWVLSAADGLPYGPVNLIRKNEKEYWFGTSKGVIHRDSSWHYYQGRRWLASDSINDLLPVEPGKVWVATPDGISEIGYVQTSLAEKAAYYETVIEKRHNRLGLVNISRLKIPGDIRSSYTQNEDNDGLWTACYLAAECFRFAATKEEKARQLALRSFEALEHLEKVTGIPGYPARSYAQASDKVVPSRSPHPKNWHSSPDGQWQWLDDTSSDEITGHLFSLSLFYDLVANESQKERVRQLVDRILTHIIGNHFQLIDFDGKPTKWAIWNPDSLNYSNNWMYERGLNSLQMLSFLKTATHISRHPRYDSIYNVLAHQQGYLQNAVQAKMYGPYETSHSDDILNFFPYYGLMQYGSRGKDYPLYIKSLERSWKAVRQDQMPVWNTMASALLRKDCDISVARRELELYPLDLVDWTMQNNDRWDLRHDPMPGRGGVAQATVPVPTPESSVSRWNTNPKRLVSGRNGETEESGSYFLFAYWMGRYYKFWD